MKKSDMDKMGQVALAYHIKSLTMKERRALTRERAKYGTRLVCLRILLGNKTIKSVLKYREAK